MVTYNHEKYIRQAIESVLMQKTNFDYELVIGEDCSTDRTKEIVLTYQKRYPNKIRTLINKRNMGAGSNFIQTLKTCKGEYIAVLDGDDYWINSYKLQKQVDFLESHPGYSISSHNVYVTQDGKNNPPIEWLGTRQKATLTLEDILEWGSGGATCSLVFRCQSINPLPEWYYYLPGGDWALQILCATQGKLYYFNEVMGVYQRGHPNNAHTIATRKIRKEGKETIGLSYKYTLDIVHKLDKHFQYRYSHFLKNQALYCYYNLAICYKQNKKYAKAKRYAKMCLREFHWRHPYFSIKRIIDLMKIALLPLGRNE